MTVNGISHFNFDNFFKALSLKNMNKKSNIKYNVNSVPISYNGQINSVYLS